MSTKQHEKTILEDLSARSEESETLSQPAKPAKKQFVEPTISIPIDVLEATTFFLPMDSGGSG